MFSFLKRHRHEKALACPAIADHHWQTLSTLPLLRGMSEDEGLLLRQHSAWFLHDRVINLAGGVALDDEQRLIIAVQCCLPLLHLGFDCLDDWREVIVYPGQFVSRNRTYESVGDYLGIVHESDDILAGQARPDGPLLLSWLDSAESPWLDGWNVPIHEIAHKLDMRSGDANGCPPLHAGMDYRAWKTAFTHAFDDLRRQDEMEQFGPIDPYAAENPAECFAVLSEYFFELPHVLDDAYPLVYQQLKLFYRQDPIKRLPRVKYRPGNPEYLPPEYLRTLP